MRFVSIASGSSGNCIYTGTEESHVLIDAGISAKRIEQGLNEVGLKTSELDGICITGGEPTLQPELPGFLEKLRELGYAIKLDTNGTYPGMLKGLLRDGILDYVAMDIKNSPQRYAETCGGADVLSRVRESVDLLLDSSIEYEFRTTVCKPLHTEKEMEEIGHWLGGAKRYFLQPFVDRGNLVSGGVQAHTQEELMRLRQAVLPDIPNTQLRGI